MVASTLVAAGAAAFFAAVVLFVVWIVRLSLTGERHTPEALQAEDGE